jgi:hypothetical protein
MNDSERQLLGEWRQVRPVPDPASIVVRFASGGQLTYVVTMGSSQEIVLTWAVDGDTLVITQPGAASGERTAFRLHSSTMLVLERDGERFVYTRS